MRSAKPTHVRRLSSFREEAVSALRGHWFKSLLTTLLLQLIMLLPAAALSVAVAYTPMPLVEGQDHAALISFYMQLFILIGGAALLTFLLTPIYTLSMNRLSVRLLSGEKTSVSTLAPSGREWAKSIRVSILGFIYSVWPVFLGFLAMMAFSAYVRMSGAGGSAPLLPADLLSSVSLLMLLPLFALMVYSITRSVSYYPAHYLLVLFPEYNARRLLKTSRRCMKGYKVQFVLLCLSFIGWALLASVLPSLLQYLPADLLHPDITDMIVSALALLFSLPLTLYFNTSLTAFILHLPCDQ